MKQKRRVLVVDDNRLNTMIVGEMLDSCGLDAVYATSGIEAIDDVKKEEFAFVIMDYIMPEMDGLEAIRLIREFSQVPVYAASGDMDEILEQKFVKVGANGSISKPFKIAQISDICAAYKLDANFGTETESADKRTEEAVQDDRLPGAQAGIYVRDYVKNVEGLDYEKGFERLLNSEKNYLKMLNVSAGNIRQCMDMLNMSRDNHSLGDLKIAIHSLAGIFGNMGHDEMQLVSKRFERSVDARIEAQLGMPEPAEVADYCAQVERVVASLEGAISGYNASVREVLKTTSHEAPEEPLAKTELEMVITYTKEALDKFEIDYLLEGLEYLKRASYGEDRRTVEKAISAADDYDYDKVGKLLEEIITV